MRKYWQNITEDELMDVFRKAAQAHEPFCDPNSIAEGWQTIEASLDRKRKRNVIAVWQFLRTHAWLPCLLIISGLLLVPIRFNNKTVLVIHYSETFDHRRSSQQPVRAGGEPTVVDFHEQVLLAESKPALHKTVAVQLMDIDKASILHTDKVSVTHDNTNQTGSRNIESAIAIMPTAPLGIGPVITVTVPERKITEVLPPQLSNTITKKADEKIPQKKYSRWSISVLAATEWNKAGNSLSVAGLTTGILMQYRLSPRLSVETGLLLSNKRYNADSGSYKPNGNTYYNLLGVVADCRVIDIPVNLRYDLLQGKSHLVFARAGLSSFWMQEETYKLTRLNNGTVEENKLRLFNENHHTFSVLNLGIGLEQQWRNILLQVSPYVKLPLTGIGHGDVKLMAFGTLVSAGYRFNTKK